MVRQALGRRAKPDLLELLDQAMGLDVRLRDITADLILILTAFGLFSAAGWARVVAIIICVIGAVAQVGMITVFPLWSLILILLYIAVIYNLTTKGMTTTAM